MTIAAGGVRRRVLAAHKSDRHAARLQQQQLLQLVLWVLPLLLPTSLLLL